MFRKHRSFNHAKYQFSGILSASSPDTSLLMLSWISLQSFSLGFSCLTSLAEADHVECMPYIPTCIFFLRAAKKEARAKIGQALSVLWWWPKSSLPRISISTANAEPSAGAVKEEDFNSILGDHCLSPLLSVRLPATYISVIWSELSISKWIPTESPVVCSWAL